MNDEFSADPLGLRLEAIARLLGRSASSFSEGAEIVRLSELLRLWAALPSTADQDAVLDFVRSLVGGIDSRQR